MTYCLSDIINMSKEINEINTAIVNQPISKITNTEKRKLHTLIKIKADIIHEYLKKIC